MTPAEARSEARRILAERKYHGSHLPRPLHGILHWLGVHLHFLVRAYHWVANELTRWFDSVANLVGGPDVLWTILGVIIVAIAVWTAMRLAQRRAGHDALLAHTGAGARSLDPRELERLADEAEHRGDLEIALRLRFRAGLLRLGAAHAVELRPGLTTREARRALRSPRFDSLARTFDEVVYGRRPPKPDDVESAKLEWPRVVEEARA
jgi:hypothetical protein